ncbi:MAG: PilZ domain-containing protein [Magnetococcales bacterium]|nr:PilZ domain-containing protein [Magnetococcales bacterium]
MLELSKSRTVLGMTENVSRGGAFVRVESPMWSLSPGVTCTLRMPNRSDVATWPCRLVRTNRTGVGIEILENMAHFLGACDLPAHHSAFQ